MTGNQITQAKEKQKYYPYCIKEGQTQKETKVQRSIISKIFATPLKRNKITIELLHIVCAYTFRSPIRLAYPLYCKIPHSNAQYGSYLLHSPTKSSIHRVEIKKYWKGINKWDMSKDKVMRLAIHFDDCLELQDNPFGESEDDRDFPKWRLISQNNRHYQALFRAIGKYKRDGVINERVMMAFGEIMAHSIAMVVVNRSENYFIIDPVDEWGTLKGNSKISKIRLWCGEKIGFLFQKNGLRIVSESYGVYQMTTAITKRNRQVLLDLQKNQQLMLNDVYLE